MYTEITHRVKIVKLKVKLNEVKQLNMSSNYEGQPENIYSIETVMKRTMAICTTAGSASLSLRKLIKKGKVRTTTLGAYYYYIDNFYARRLRSYNFSFYFW